jgi:hypothetical protein
VSENPSSDPISKELQQLRRKQMRAVMPFIGPLLDAWDDVPNDLKGEIEEGATDLAEALDSIRVAMEGDDGE